MASVSIRNLSRSSTDFYVGDRWVVAITGADPLQAVTMWSRINGVGDPGGAWAYGTTDSAGNFRIEGTMGREDVGAWQQFWLVGGVQILPTLSFRVRPTPTSPSELPFEIPESNWENGNSHTPITKVLFVSDDQTLRAMPMDIVLGKVLLGGWARPWNLMTSVVGSRLPARRRVYAY